MLGALLGDIVGSIYEFNPIKTKEFILLSKDSFFTDDTVLTVATMDALISGRSFGVVYKEYARKYPDSGFGGMFRKWAFGGTSDPYNSFGNGSAMRVSPIAWAFDDLDEVLGWAAKSAEVTHNHVEGIKGAQAVAAAIFLARKGNTKDEIKKYVENNFGYALGRTVKEVRESAEFDETCQISVPESIIAFLDSNSTEDAIRNAVSFGADADTQACIAGSIAEAYYKDISEVLADEITKYLTNELNIVVRDFRKFTKCRNAE